MKLFKNILILFLLLGNPVISGNPDNANRYPTISVESQFSEMVLEIHAVRVRYEIQFKSLYRQLSIINRNLLKTKDHNQQLQYLLIKDRLKEKIESLRRNEQTDISKIRYIKGLQIIKILYEKTLALDHHFSTVSTFSEINQISNPNHYPEFVSAKELIQNKKDRRSGFDLTQVLGDNIYTSVAHSFISLFTNNNTSKTEKETSLKEVECILDFTLRMHNDLNTIYFETIFLQKSNDNIMQELHQLFVDFTKPIAYDYSLKECRNTDDWDRVREHLNAYLDSLDKLLQDDGNIRKAHKMQINLEFPIDRLLQFITQYNAFIDQGAKFYEKFGIMLNSYENEQHCANQIPVEYTKLKENIALATEKFNTAYKPVEINGSKMKEILYGINEYE